MKKMSRPAALRWVALALGLLALAATVWRLQRGVEFTDEAYYVAMPARFVMGDRPFVDELNIGQTAGLLLYPFVRIYAWIAGWTGIYLFVRALYVAFFAVVGGSAFTLARTHLPTPAAILVGVSCTCFIPYGAPGLSYNTLGSGFLTIGLFLVCRSLTNPSDRPPRLSLDPLVWAGVAHAAAAFAYPTLFVGTVLQAVALLAFASGARLRAFLRFCAGGFGFVLLLLPVMVRAGAGHLRLVAEYFNATGAPAAKSASTLDQVAAMWSQFASAHPDLWKHGALIAIAAVLVRRWPLAVGLLLVAVPLYVKVPSVGPSASMHYVSCFALCGPLFAIALRNRRAARALVLSVWLPSLAAGVAAGMSSGNGVVAAGIGLFPGAIVSALLLAMWIDETAKRWAWPFLRAMAQLAPATFVLALLQYELADDAIYRDQPLSKLTARVTEGPFKGLYTTPERKVWLGVITADIRKYRSGPRTLFYYDFPAGYLIADQPPLVPSVWIFSWFSPRAALDTRYFQARVVPGEYVLVHVGFALARIDEAEAQRVFDFLEGMEQLGELDEVP